jgi:histone H3/H4
LPSSFFEELKEHQEYYGPTLFVSEEDYLANELPIECEIEDMTYREMLDDKKQELLKFQESLDRETPVLTVELPHLPELSEDAPLDSVQDQLDEIDEIFEEYERETETRKVIIKKFHETFGLVYDLQDDEYMGDDPDIQAAQNLNSRSASIEEILSMTERLNVLLDKLTKDNNNGSRKRKRDECEALNEIRCEQSSTELILEPRAFRKLTEELIAEYRTDTIVTDDAVEALQTACEDYLVKMFRQAGKAAIHANRTFITTKDIQFVVHLTDDA